MKCDDVWMKECLLTLIENSLSHGNDDVEIMCENGNAFFNVQVITKNILALAVGALYSAPAPAFVTNFRGRGRYLSGANWSLPTPQMGQTQSSCRSANNVPGLIPWSGSPMAGS